ncbi:unnamed protein product [Moneuplotes crassus]|uniref:Uncharacterized protein n=1 Tax=Euplotes crassus TaxID=5936 RepID=A0AAD1XSC6_EUPCR|nr:unnamed protein product [Moneuplotes crassus]
MGSCSGKSNKTKDAHGKADLKSALAAASSKIGKEKNIKELRVKEEEKSVLECIKSKDVESAMLHVTATLYESTRISCYQRIIEHLNILIANLRDIFEDGVNSSTLESANAVVYSANKLTSFKELITAKRELKKYMNKNDYSEACKSVCVDATLKDNFHKEIFSNEEKLEKLTEIDKSKPTNLAI